MSASRCIKLLLLLSLIPLALRATSLLLGGRHAVPAAATASSRHHSWRTAWHGQSSSRATASASVVVSAEPVVRVVRPYRRASTHRSAAASDGGTRRLRQVPGGGDWFEDDKRLAPTGSNPLHNLR